MSTSPKMDDEDTKVLLEKFITCRRHNPFFTYLSQEKQAAEVHRSLKDNDLRVVRTSQQIFFRMKNLRRKLVQLETKKLTPEGVPAAELTQLLTEAFGRDQTEKSDTPAEENKQEVMDKEKKNEKNKIVAGHLVNSDEEKGNYSKEEELQAEMNVHSAALYAAGIKAHRVESHNRCLESKVLQQQTHLTDATKTIETLRQELADLKMENHSQGHQPESTAAVAISSLDMSSQDNQPSIILPTGSHPSLDSDEDQWEDL